MPDGSKFTGSPSPVKGRGAPAVIQKDLLVQAVVNKFNWGQFEGIGIVSQNDGIGKRKMIQDPFLWMLNVLVELAKKKKKKAVLF